MYHCEQMKKLTSEFINIENLLLHQWELIDKFEILEEKINNKSDTIDDVSGIYRYYEWYSRRFNIWIKYNNLNKLKKWSREWLLCLKNNRIIKPSFTKFIFYINYKYGDMCEFCEEYECFLSSCICCAKFGCMKCVECYTDKNFGSCYNCNIKE